MQIGPSENCLYINSEVVKVTLLTKSSVKRMLSFQK
ncbi:hypothetical protein T4B_11681 [Trichinella pseudospiralis]|uniref:Uncharacterized protein n=1 Tax=Trichinella pseudospiralis TaxID=6337 RepID=A0A0V1GMX9_TRIPS|nr:hypothetical protein T4B_11681 [Trichinella pseudospiralis]